MIEAGLRVCVNTDDPGWFDTDLMTELTVVTDDLAVGRDQHLAMQRDAVAASFAPADVRRCIVEELDVFERTHT